MRSVQCYRICHGKMQYFVIHTHKSSLTTYTRLPAESLPPPRPTWTHTWPLSSLQWRIVGPRHFGKYLNSTLFPVRLLSALFQATSHLTASDFPPPRCPAKIDMSSSAKGWLHCGSARWFNLRREPLSHTSLVYVEIKTLAVASSKVGQSHQRWQRRCRAARRSLSFSIESSPQQTAVWKVFDILFFPLHSANQVACFISVGDETKKQEPSRTH